MKKNITLGALLGSLFIYLSVIDFDGALVRFLLTGELPGEVSLSADAMLLLITGIVAIIIAFLVMSTIIPPQRSLAKKLPKQRYTLIQ